MKAGTLSVTKVLLFVAIAGVILAIQTGIAQAVVVAPNVARDPHDVPPPITRTTPITVEITLIAEESVAEIAPGKKFWFWTFRTEGETVGKVPAPMIRVMEGDTIRLTLKNLMNNVEPHNIDFHASMGPGGGAAVTNVEPGESKTFSFKALRQGAYIYHCAGEGMPWEHVAHGMYGLIMVEPPGGLPAVDKEFYVGQNDWYLKPMGPHRADQLGIRSQLFDLDEEKALDEFPVTYYTFNGHTKALTEIFPPMTQQGNTNRFFFVTGGPNIGSNWHIIGTIFDKVYTGHPEDFVRNEETVYVAPGSAAVFELMTPVPGQYTIVDHALWRVPKGAAGLLHVMPTVPPTETDPIGSWPTDIFYPPAFGPSH